MWELDAYFTIMLGFFQKRKVVKGGHMDTDEKS